MADRKPRGELAELTASLQNLCTMGKRSDKELRQQVRAHEGGPGTGCLVVLRSACPGGWRCGQVGCRPWARHAGL